MKRIAIIHTTPATIDSLTILVKKEMKDIDVINILDDSMLKDMVNNNMPEAVEERWLKYADIANSMGVDAILSACSTVGEFAEKANNTLKVPVYRIDAAMAEKAVNIGKTISVFATLSSTLDPTVRLIRRKAEVIGKDCTINTILVPGAYDELIKGNREAHNLRIQEEVHKYIESSDVIVLAQASMAAALDNVDGIEKEKILTSPALGIAKLKKELDR